MEEIKLGEYYIKQSENNPQNRIYDKDSLIKSLEEFKMKCSKGRGLVEDKIFGYYPQPNNIIVLNTVAKYNTVANINLQNVVAKIEDIKVEEVDDRIIVYGNIKPLKKIVEDYIPTFGLRGLSNANIIENGIVNHNLIKIITFDLIDIKKK